jgi:iron complex outermembrane receptor protein
VLIPNNSSARADYSTGRSHAAGSGGRYEFPYGVGLALGVQNASDEYPQFTPTALKAPPGSVGFPSYSPYGFNGRFLYARLNYEF